MLRKYFNTCIVFILLFSSIPVLAEPGLESIMFDQSVATRGETVDATITLTEIAPNEGTKVTLLVPEDLECPRIVTVPGGTKETTFPVIVNEKGSYGKTALQGTVNSTSYKGASLDLEPMTIQLTFPQTQIRSGQTITGTLRTGTKVANSAQEVGRRPAYKSFVFKIRATAGSGWQLPESITLPEGEESVSFEIVGPEISGQVGLSADVILESDKISAGVRLNIEPIKIEGISFDKPSVLGGQKLNATIRISAPAPKGGLFLYFNSPPSLGFPSHATIPEGSKSTTILIETDIVSSAQFAQVKVGRAGIGVGYGFEKDASVELKPGTPNPTYTIASLTINPALPVAGDVTATVTLSGNAPVGGAPLLIIPMLDGGCISDLPGSVTIPANQKEATFKFNVISSVGNRYCGLRMRRGNTGKEITFRPPPIVLTQFALKKEKTGTRGFLKVNGTVTRRVIIELSATTLGTSDQAVSIPATIEIEGGQSSVSFAIKPKRSGEGKEVLIKANVKASSPVEKTLKVKIARVGKMYQVVPAEDTKKPSKNSRY